MSTLSGELKAIYDPCSLEPLIEQLKDTVTSDSCRLKVTNHPLQSTPYLSFCETSVVEAALIQVRAPLT